MRPTPIPNNAGTHIGIFDSGVGGLSVLRAIHAAMPLATLSYLADTAHAPFGDRDDDHVLQRSHAAAAHLVDAGAQLLVVACNTATAVAIASLRSRWRALPIVGVEPGLKPALALSRSRRIGILATPATLRSARFEQLCRDHGEGALVHAQPCPGLAASIEAGDRDDADLLEMLAVHCRALRAAEVDVAVLGCTHYAFVRHHIERLLGPGIAIVDTAEAVAKQVTRLAAALPPSSAAQDTYLHFMTSGDAATLERIVDQWLGLHCKAETLRQL